MTDAEREICARLRRFREEERQPRNRFAEVLGITEVKLVSIEHGHTPLRYNLAWRLAQRFNLNLRWLATGEGLAKPRLPIPSAVEADLPKAELFSHVFFSKLHSQVEASMQTLQVIDQLRQRLWDLIEARGEPRRKHLALWVPRPEWIPALKERLRLLNLFRDELDHELKMLEAGISVSAQQYGPPPETGSDSQAEGENESKNYFTVADTSGMVTPDMSRWEELRKRLKPLLIGHGRKAALARELRLTRAAISAWFKPGGGSAPQGETMLQLQQWVALAEVERSAAATTPAPAVKAAPRKPAAKGKAKR